MDLQPGRDAEQVRAVVLPKLSSGSRFWSSSDVESEVHDIALTDDVLLALQT